MRIYPLALPTKEASMYLADIHLRQTVSFIAKILSDMLHQRLTIPVKINYLNETEYWLNGAKLMPPSGKPTAWSKWAATNGLNAWWLVDFAYALNNEAKYRFEMEEPVPDYLRIQQWMVKGVLNAMPRQNSISEFPIALPQEEVLRLGDTSKMSPVQIYREHYASQKGKVRMRWSRREKPTFMFSDADGVLLDGDPSIKCPF